MTGAAVATIGRPAFGKRGGLFVRSYSILGHRLTLVSDSESVLASLDVSYGAFRVVPEHDDYSIEVLRDGDSVVVRDVSVSHSHSTEQHALLDSLDRITSFVLRGLDGRGLLAVHAGAVVYRERAVALSGRSGHGKTTLVLGLLRRGLGLLSDELAVVDPESCTVLPYRRSLHVRPATLALIPELAGLRDLPRRDLGGGNEWAVSPARLERAIPGALASPAPLGAVLVLGEPPIPKRPPSLSELPSGLAAMELLRSTWSASVDLDGALSRTAAVLEDVRCARLVSGKLEPTVDAVLEWLDEDWDA